MADTPPKVEVTLDPHADHPARPYFTAAHLAQCYEKGGEWGLERRADIEVTLLPPGLRYPVTDWFLDPTGTYVGCVVLLNSEGYSLTLDVPKAFFQALPVIYRGR
ncbi:hypothetical protein J0H58_13355 [bacterium]|nr:hypothetical protein [bacterium]